ncbi:disulfide oxidoreductase [Chengkuizengella axinellae]|uniref:Disulfide oxidoreductase n=1 Tax=Chengkuizengella axinellae TaxID=3064388 RepID=A0ABT9IYN4_9BACL|nr:disulfide oxidoreductase [Chengkuizengella sp. 2205SS18-9]MDP5274479.1 disulfide oxidoreductase [Chengkuizengella sp. 2205SS18-9]
MKLKKMIQTDGLYMSWAISLIATLGSLYFSEIRGYIPCTYCWYQRILMYPLVIILGIAALRKDVKIVVYTLPITILGVMISGYHYIIQKTSLFQDTGSSCGIVPCNASYINWLNFITIPFLSFIAFTLISMILILIWKFAPNEKQEIK